MSTLESRDDKISVVSECKPSRDSTVGTADHLNQDRKKWNSTRFHNRPTEALQDNFTERETSGSAQRLSAMWNGCPTAGISTAASIRVEPQTTTVCHDPFGNR